MLIAGMLKIMNKNIKDEKYVHTNHVKTALEIKALLVPHICDCL